MGARTRMWAKHAISGAQCFVATSAQDTANASLRRLGRQCLGSANATQGLWVRYALSRVLRMRMGWIAQVMEHAPKVRQQKPESVPVLKVGMGRHVVNVFVRLRREYLTRQQGNARAHRMKCA